MRQYFLLLALVGIFLSGCAGSEPSPDLDEENKPLFPPSSIEGEAFLTPAERRGNTSVSETAEDSDAEKPAEEPNYQENRTNVARSSSPEEILERNRRAEQELAQVNSKVEALETKIEVLREELRQMQVRGSQPQIQASRPMEIEESNDPPADVETSLPTSALDRTNISSAATVKPNVIRNNQNSTEVEQKFESAMQQLQKGEHRESANSFFALAKEHPEHILASHALFWAGEAGARSQNWKISILHWTKIEREYPKSNYIPEVLAGLSRAYDATGNKSLARKYKETLVQAFPDAPATLNFMSAEESPQGKEL